MSLSHAALGPSNFCVRSFDKKLDETKCRKIFLPSYLLFILIAYMGDKARYLCETNCLKGNN